MWYRAICKDYRIVYLPKLVCSIPFNIPRNQRFSLRSISNCSLLFHYRFQLHFDSIPSSHHSESEWMSFCPLLGAWLESNLDWFCLSLIALNTWLTVEFIEFSFQIGTFWQANLGRITRKNVERSRKSSDGLQKSAIKGECNQRQDRSQFLLSRDHVATSLVMGIITDSGQIRTFLFQK